jgi:hypothetical protein
MRVLIADLEMIKGAICNEEIGCIAYTDCMHVCDSKG